MPPAVTTAEDLLRAGDIGRCELRRGRLVMLLRGFRLPVREIFG
jgi:hypothetical protein